MDDFYRRGFLVLTVAVLGYALWQVLTPFWGALAWSICLAVLLAPLQDALTRRFGDRPGAAAGLLTALTPFVVFVPIALLGMAFVDQGRALIYELQRSPWRIDADTLTRIEEYPVIGPVISRAVALLDLDGAQVSDWVVGVGQSLLRLAANLGSSLVINVLSTTVAFLMMLFLLFFMLRDGRAMLRRVSHLAPLDAQYRERLTDLMANTTRAVVYGSGLTALIQGALTAIGFALTGLPSPIVFGVLAALFSLLPAGGTAFVWVPATLALAGMGRNGAALFMLAWGAFISVSDNFLRPLLVSKQAHVSALAVFVGVVGGAAAFGGVGLIVGPVLLTLVSALVRFVEEMRLAGARDG
ncbi:MAG: AI-2E family transporter [Gammaproteobacteria bacterium]